jgi:adenylate cyclase
MQRPPPPAPPDDPRNERYWREYLEHPDTFMKFGRQVFSHIPSDPRCQLCASPFEGFGGGMMRLIGKRPSDGNPRVCNTCQNFMIKHHGGAEVAGTLLFADVRGSTAMAERMSPAEFNALLDRYYSVASKSVFAHSGVVDKFVGDELVAAFTPNFGADHVRRAVGTALELLRATGHDDPGGPWVPIGAGIHTGLVWFGAVGEGPATTLTLLGDTVNTAARLGAAAGAGEVLVSVDAAKAAELDPSLPHRSLDLKGKQAAFEVVSLTLGAA